MDLSCTFNIGHFAPEVEEPIAKIFSKLNQFRLRTASGD